MVDQITPLRETDGEGVAAAGEKSDGDDQTVCTEVADDDDQSISSSENEVVVEEQQPHPTLEYPLLYHTLKRFFPAALQKSLFLYTKRWSLSYPLRHRIPLGRFFRRLGIQLTWGEFLFLVPFFAAIVAGITYTMLFPSVSATGKIARYALIAAMVLAQRNSLVTLLIGMPVDRALFYHKLAGKLAGFTGLLHTAAFFVDPRFRAMHLDDFLGGAFTGRTNASGSFMMMLLAAISLSALPKVRQRLFEVFYYLHLVFLVGLVIGAFFHSGMLVPTLTCLTWGGDLVIRKALARMHNPKVGYLKVISETVVQVSFPKTVAFAYNPGQYVYLAVPEISWLQWHPFSISSAPHQGTVNLHIRKVGDWTGALFDLASKKSEVPILLEGPYGNLSVDIIGDRKYKSIMLISGGIGITPMQSICNQLLHESAEGRRDLRYLKFIWIERDPVLVAETDFAQQQMKRMHQSTAICWDLQPICSNPELITSQLLASFAPIETTDEELEEQYAEDEYPSSCGAHDIENSKISSRTMGSASSSDGLDVQIYLTGAADANNTADLPAGVRWGRPNIQELFQEMKQEAMALGETKVAVCVSAPRQLMNLARQASVMHSDDAVRFDLHFETMAV